ncbi:hypothetical protein IAR50_006944 [Cryptococcus sp. DSM 104548]
MSYPPTNGSSSTNQPRHTPPPPSSSDAASAQADLSPHNVAEQHSGTQDRENETASALRTLFGENGEMTLGQAGEDVDRPGTQQLGGDPNIDPALSNMPSPSSHPSASQPLVEPPKTPSESQTNKRKATSRANMLARGGACEFCKRRKLKCSAEQPACANCIKSGRECVYAQKRQRSRVKMLEDRLQELEKKMVNGESSGSSGMEQGQGYEDHLTLAQLDLSRFAPGKRVIPEPDLMTLADAAASNTRVDAGDLTWEAMGPEQITAELVKAADGQQGVGESMVAHLVELYINAPVRLVLHNALPPTRLNDRLSPSSPNPIHPSLLLALLPSIFFLSPYTCFQDPSLPALLLSHSRQYGIDAISQGDPRMHDLTIASVLRSFAYFSDSKNIEGWVENTASTGLLRAAGFAKLGHVGERLVPNLGDYGELENSMKRLERERQLRVAMHKGAIVPPPRNAQELSERINLFWFSYMMDRGSSIGWGWPATYSEKDISTPFPKDTPTPSALLDNSTVLTFLASDSGAPSSATPDSDFCALVKALTLYHKAFSLFDASGSEADVKNEKDRIKKLTDGYMRYLREVKGEWGVGRVTVAETWVTLYATSCCLHLRDDIDSGFTHTGGHLDQMLEAAEKILQHTYTVQSAGDPTLQSYTVCTAVIFLVIGRLLITTTQELMSSSHAQSMFEAEIVSLRSKTEAFKKVLAAQGAWLPFARISARLLENVEVGTLWKAGEWERGDGGD